MIKVSNFPNIFIPPDTDLRKIIYIIANMHILIRKMYADVFLRMQGGAPHLFNDGFQQILDVKDLFLYVLPS